MGKLDDIQKAGDILKELFGHLNFQEGEAYVSFFSDWMDLVGVDLACHVRPVDIRRNALLLEVDHPGWMQMFQLNQKRILHRIQKKHPSLRITSIHFRLTSSPVEEPPQGAVRRNAPLPTPIPTSTPSQATESSDQPHFTSQKPILNERLRRALEVLGKQINKRSKPGR